MLSRVVLVLVEDVVLQPKKLAEHPVEVATKVQSIIYIVWLACK